jgi:coenzyme F420-0:L-glutamate ligase / coenzyme F420-1:gamma-L-glutamate ligase
MERHMLDVPSLTFTPLAPLPEIAPGIDLAALLAERLARAQLAADELCIVLVAQKIISKAEGRFIELDSVTPSQRARHLAALTRKDPRLVEVILAESDEIVRAVPHVLIVRHRLGFVMANAGVDRSNVPATGGRERVLLLPLDPDASAARLRAALLQRLAARVAVIVTDSFGRPWRRGVTNVALGCAGLPALIDRRGELDRDGRALEVTEVALADALAAGAGLVMGEAGEGRPVVVARGLSASTAERGAAALLRPKEEDLFR